MTLAASSSVLGKTNFCFPPAFFLDHNGWELSYSQHTFNCLCELNGIGVGNWVSAFWVICFCDFQHKIHVFFFDILKFSFFVFEETPNKSLGLVGGVVSVGVSIKF